MTPSVQDRDVFVALRRFLTHLFPDVAVIQTQQNRSSPPKNAFITMNSRGRKRLSTNLRTYVDTDEKQAQDTVMPTEYTVQVDFYGSGSGDRAQTFCTLFFDYTACDFFPETVRPLFVTDPAQIPLTSGEEQFVERWTVEVKLQINPVISVPMDFFENPSLTLIPVPLNEE